MTAGEATVDLNVTGLELWLSDNLSLPVSELRAARIGGGNSSGALQLDFTTPQGAQSLVLKAPNDGGLVFDCDATREAAILTAAHLAGAPVPKVIAIEATGTVVGAASFVMELAEGRGVPDSTPASFHDDGWFREETDGVQRGIWFSFLDALAKLHAVDTFGIPASYGDAGVAGYLDYWRRSLLDAAAEKHVPRQLAVIDWLAANIPPDADDLPALCMGDARLGNAILQENYVRTLVDFEVAYIGNPAADIGYCVMQEAFTRMLSQRPATGIPTVEETWDYWEAATGRTVSDRSYWTALGATLMCVTATRAMLKWGFPVETIDDDNIVVAELEGLVAGATAAKR